MIQQSFNSDLLMTERDRELAFECFPHLKHVLDFPELREAFEFYNCLTDKANSRRRCIGITAILSVTCSLLGISSEPLFSGMSDGSIKLLEGLFAVCGILGALFGVIGVLSDKLREQWLYGRLATESIRQFYFLILVRRIASVTASLEGGKTQEAFVKARSRWWAGFSLNINEQLPGMLRATLENERDWPLTEDPEERDSAILDLPLTNEIFDAYRTLRLLHQLQYANYKLRTGGIGSPVSQLSFLRRLTFTSISIVFAIHMLLVYSLLTNTALAVKGPLSHLLIVWCCIVALAAHALEEGLQPAREIERYTRYRNETEALLKRFDSCHGAREKICVMEEMEVVVYREMRGFLIANSETRFIL